MFLLLLFIRPESNAFERDPFAYIINSLALLIFLNSRHMRTKYSQLNENR